MVKFNLFLIFYVFSLVLTAQTEIEKTPLTIGDQIIIKSTILNQNRKLNIYLPISYSQNPDKNYPVIYLLDGSLDEDFLHIMGILQFGSFPWINMNPEAILIGISNIDRKHDFTYPTNNKQDKEEFPTTGASNKFIEFIEKELQPYIESKYRIDGKKTIIGQSLGGLLATEILFTKPDLFDTYLIISPSLWWDDESLLKMRRIIPRKPKSIYVGVGKEGPVMERTAKELYEHLSKRKNINSSIFYNFFPEQNHGDALHLAVYDAFKRIHEEKKK